MSRNVANILNARPDGDNLYVLALIGTLARKTQAFNALRHAWEDLARDIDKYGQAATHLHDGQRAFGEIRHLGWEEAVRRRLDDEAVPLILIAGKHIATLQPQHDPWFFVDLRHIGSKRTRWGQTFGVLGEWINAEARKAGEATLIDRLAAASDWPTRDFPPGSLISRRYDPASEGAAAGGKPDPFAYWRDGRKRARELLDGMRGEDRHNREGIWLRLARSLLEEWPSRAAYRYTNENSLKARLMREFS